MITLEKTPRFVNPTTRNCLMNQGFTHAVIALNNLGHTEAAFTHKADADHFAAYLCHHYNWPNAYAVEQLA